MGKLTQIRKLRGRAKPAKGRGPFAIHVQHNDGTEMVCLGNLRVLITHQADCWLAQGLEIDYAIDGSSVEDVKARFEEGLTLTVKSHLRVYKGIQRLLKNAPQEIWDKFYAAVPPDLQHHQALVTVRVLPPGSQHVLPFDRIIYAQAA